MNHLTKEYVTKLKDSLLFINAVVIIYNASLFLLSSKYISVHYYARDFLNKVSYITRTPQNIFFESIFLFIILVLLMKLREKDNLKMACKDEKKQIETVCNYDFCASLHRSTLSESSNQKQFIV